ncbi:choline transporter-like 1 isoform X2 [Glossina fuscipes]|uniref:Choline transporter-like protein n=1 Tax=Glossina fuscipes TaxID=7396 RepID=A0A9C6DKH7_9MUSC|nr:choline transporter-like 1 isoform X2 [Glossina fuscipes]
MGCASSSEDEQQQNIHPKYRTCTDTFWLTIYIIFWLFLIVIAIFSFVYGNPLRVINGYDSFGNTCGVKKNEHYTNFPLSGMNTIDKPQLFYFDVRKLKESIKICVKECPSKTLTNRQELYKYFQDYQTKFCRYDFDMSLISNEATGNLNQFFNHLGPCPQFPVYESEPVLHRCMPKSNKAPVKDMYKMLNSWDAAQQFLCDIHSTWHFIAIICGLSFLISIALVILMHWLSRIVSWLICIFVIVASLGLTVALWYAYYSIRNKTKTNAQFSYLEEFVRNEQAVFVLAILATITMIILLVIIYYLKNKLSGLSALFEEAGQCMMNLPGLLIAPLLAFVVLALFLAFWVLVVMCIATASAPGQSPIAPFDNTAAQATSTSVTIKNNTDSDYKTILRVEYTEAKALKSMFWIYVVGLIWTTEFIFACQQFALAAAVAFWYFDKPTTSPTIYAIGKLIKYHLGTAAKGSFVITIFKIPRLILTYLYAKLKKGEDKGSQCAFCCLKCCICGFWLLEKFIRFLNHNAYTVVAIESINFCPAAGIAWNAMATNALQVATINSVGDFILFLGKAMVAALSGLIGIFVLKDKPGLNFYMAPVILIIIFSFFVAHIVLSLFEMVVDTLFLCVCEDKTINGRAGRWAKSNLARLVGEEPLQAGEEPPIQVVEMMPINKQPFSMTHRPTVVPDGIIEPNE